MSKTPVALGLLILTACSTAGGDLAVALDGSSTSSDLAPDSASPWAAAAQPGRDANDGGGDPNPGAAFPAILSAFFGADDVPPMRGLAGCNLPSVGPGGLLTYDGMPVVFREEIDQAHAGATLRTDAFEVVLADGSTRVPVCATLTPADNENEDQTVLLAGDFGSGSVNGVSQKQNPVLVRVKGDLFTESGANLKGESVMVTPLAAGPRLAYAYRVSESELADNAKWQNVDATSSATMGTSCPNGTNLIVRVIWQGGVTIDGRNELTDTQRRRYRVVFAGQPEGIVPPAMGDLNDGDNNQDLCFSFANPAAMTPTSVSVPMNTVADPTGDKNPDTSIDLPK